MIVLILTEFLPCTLVSNCYLVTIFFIPIIRKKFEFTSHAHSWSFANVIILCRLGWVHVVFLSYYYRERIELKWKNYMIYALPNRNWHEFQTFYIRPRSGTDSAQWDWGIRCNHILRYCIILYCIFQAKMKLTLTQFRSGYHALKPRTLFWKPVCQQTLTLRMVTIPFYIYIYFF